MPRPDELDRVVDLLREPFNAGDIVAAHEDAEPCETEDTAARGDRFDLIVRVTTSVPVQRSHVTVTTDHRRCRRCDRVHRGAVARMRYVHPHPYPIHFLDELMTERTQPAIMGLVTAITDVILLVIGQTHVADAELIVETDEIQVDLYGIASLKMKAYRELAGALGLPDVCGVLDQAILR